MTHMAPASLTSRLLVKKGGAQPASVTPGNADLGNLGLVVDSSAQAKPRPRAKAQRTQVTLRLDSSRHRRLKLTSAHLRVSQQDLVTAALDAYLNDISAELLNSDCTCITMQEPEPGPDTIFNDLRRR